jgi:hypothetical protein
MNLESLEASFRTDADDAVVPYLWSSDEVKGWFNEAQEEACVRGNLIFEASRPELTQIAVSVAAGNTYKLNELMHEINYASITDAGGHTTELVLKNRSELSRICPNWRTTSERPRFLVHYDKTLELGCVINAPYTMKVEGHRLPLKCLKDDSDIPEINRNHHIHLVQWVLYRAYQKPDSETLNPGKADDALKRFEDYFGPRPDANLRKDENADLPHHNRSYW